MRVLITGASGALGYHLTNFMARDKKSEVVGGFFSRPVTFEIASSVPLNFTVEAQCEEVLRRFSPTHVVHAGALTHTGICEKYPDEAERTNVRGTQNLVNAACKLGTLPHFIYISTDLVFDGKSGPYSEDDTPHPIQVYGKTKLCAEESVCLYKGAWTILRSSLIFAPPMVMRKTFLDWMIAGIKAKEGFLFYDEFRTPVYVIDVCRAIGTVCARDAGGIYHCAGQERLSRYEFGLLVAEEFGLPRKNVRKRSMHSVKNDAPRPSDVSLNSEKLRTELGISPTRCSDALREIANMPCPKA